MAPEQAEDGRYIVVDGRRWRATDPAIPDQLEAELTSELMAARRAVRAATTADDEARARARVQDAKVALGERGRPWWEEPDPDALRVRLASATRSLLRTRAPESSICPSEIARIAGGAHWRDGAMDAARDTAARLAGSGVVRVTQGDEEVADPTDPATWRGAVRLRRGPTFADGAAGESR